jgi:hypothetical protein
MEDEMNTQLMVRNSGLIRGNSLRWVLLCDEDGQAAEYAGKMFMGQVIELDGKLYQVIGLQVSPPVAYLTAMV